MLNKCRCINPLFRAEYLEVDCYTVRDNVCCVTFILCPRCYERVRSLKGYQIIAYPRDSTRQKHDRDKFKKIPF